MTTTTHTAVKADTSLISIAFAAFMGLSILFVAGFAGSETLHNAAHDARHAIGFACH